MDANGRKFPRWEGNAESKRLRYTDQFDDPNLPGEIQLTVTLRKVSCGTEVNIVQEGVPAIGGLQIQSKNPAWCRNYA